MQAHGNTSLNFLSFDDNQITTEGLKEIIALCDGSNILFSVMSCVIGVRSCLENPIGNEGFHTYLNQFFVPHFAAIDALNFQGCQLTASCVPPLLEKLDVQKGQGHGSAICAVNLSGG